MTEQLAFALSDFAPACVPPAPDELHDLARLDGVPEPLFRLLVRDSRHSDLLTEYDDLTALLVDGYTEKDITTATGFNHAALHRRLRLAALISEIRALHQATPHSNAILEACAKLPAPVQLALAEQAIANGTRITARDITNVKRARADEAQAALPDDIFSPAPAALPQVDWRVAVHLQLAQILQTIPANEAESVRAALQQAVEDLDFLIHAENAFKKRVGD